MVEEKTVTAVILVAGNSTRYGQNRNKNFEIIHGKPVMLYSLEEFLKRGGDSNHPKYPSKRAIYQTNRYDSRGK